MLASHVVDQDGDRLPGIEFLLPGEIPTAVEESTASQPPTRITGAARKLPESIQSHHPHPLCPAPSKFCQAGYLQCGGPVDLHLGGGRHRLGLSRGDVGRAQRLGLQRGQRNLLRRPQGPRPAQDPTHDPGPLNVGFIAPSGVKMLQTLYHDLTHLFWQAASIAEHYLRNTYTLRVLANFLGLGGPTLVLCGARCLVQHPSLALLA